MRCPFAACSASAISALVTPASAETTTIGSLSARDRDDAPRARDRLGVADGGAAELENDHAAPSRPRCTSSSALSTDAPAAPRMTLCPIATSFTSKIGSARTRPTTTVMPLPVST